MNISHIYWNNDKVKYSYSLKYALYYKKININSRDIINFNIFTIHLQSLRLQK